MLMRFILLAIIQLWLIESVVGVVPQITRLNVQCDRTGMRVNVDFDIPFNGIVFSKGHYSDANCRYVNPLSRRSSYNFFIPTTLCGTIQTDARRDGTVGFKNVIIFQNDPDYQEVWDMARKISCDWVTRIDKYVTFAPFGVDMLGIKEIAFPGDTVDCWMDIQRGHGPFAPAIAGVVPIGEKLTIVIYIRDKDSSFDIHVKDCYAYDSPDYKREGVRAIQLTDQRGCPIKEKLVKGFYRTRDVRNSGATIIAYGVINAFKFPEAMDVFLACNVEVCKGGCENPCQPEVSMAGGDADVEFAKGPNAQIPDTQQKTDPDEGDEETNEVSTPDTPAVDEPAPSDGESPPADSNEPTDDESGGTGSTDEGSSETDGNDSSSEATSEAPSSESSDDGEASTEAAFTERPAETEEPEEEADTRRAAAASMNLRSAVKLRAKKSKRPIRRHTIKAKSSAKLVRKPKTTTTTNTRNRKLKNAKNAKLQTTAPTLKKRGKRSIIISGLNGTFSRMTHGISIISPVEDFDDQELELWQRAKEVDKRVCFSSLSLITSSITLTALSILFSMSLVLSYGRIRRRSGEKSFS